MFDDAGEGTIAFAHHPAPSETSVLFDAIPVRQSIRLNRNFLVCVPGQDRSREGLSPMRPASRKFLWSVAMYLSGFFAVAAVALFISPFLKV